MNDDVHSPAGDKEILQVQRLFDHTFSGQMFGGVHDPADPGEFEQFTQQLTHLCNCTLDTIYIIFYLLPVPFFNVFEKVPGKPFNGNERCFQVV